VLALRRRTVGVDQEVLVSVVCRLQRRARLDVNELARSKVVTLRRLAEVHRQRPGENDERLLLQYVPVATSLRTGLVAPNVRPSVREARGFAQLGDVARGLIRLVRAGDPLEPVRADDAESHAAIVAERLTESLRSSNAPSARLNIVRRVDYRMSTVERGLTRDA
jgi:hypothetical protein